MKNTKVSLFFVALLLGAMLPAGFAEVTMPGDTKARPGLYDITNKFVRNMKLIRDMTPEKEVVTQMNIVIEQADGIVKLYSENGAGRKREVLLREMKELEGAKNVSKRDLEKIDKMKAEIQELDADGLFMKSGQYLTAAINELRNLLDQVYTKDEDRNQLLRITRMHLEVYQYAYRELMK